MATVKNLDWKSNQELLLLNPRLPKAVSAAIASVERPKLPGHIWIASSGTSTVDVVKLYAISFRAFLSSAAAVNEHLCARKDDTWLNPLPTFHVGGIGIFARAYLTGSHVVDISEHSWKADFFLNRVHAESVTLTSLVPTQLYDIVALNTLCPPSLRAIVVGGGALHPDLYRRARELGYPVLPSYGMTETASQIATAPLESLRENGLPRLKILPHVRASVNEENRIVVRSDSVYTAKIMIPLSEGLAQDEREMMLDRDRKSKVEVEYSKGEFVGEDYVSLEDGYLIPLGRKDEAVKISGELVSVSGLREQLLSIAGADKNLTLILETDARRGHRVCAVFDVADFNASGAWVEEFNRAVIPVGRITKAYYLTDLPRNELGKLKLGEVRLRLRL